MNERRMYDMVVVGGGPGGYSAALYAARAGLDTVVLEKLSAGGQMALTQQIDNYPGFEEGVDGFELGEKMQAQAHRFGAVTEYAEVHGVDFTSDPKVIHTSEGAFYGRTVVIATGANPRELGLAGERELVGDGISFCAVCDGDFFAAFFRVIAKMCDALFHLVKWKVATVHGSGDNGALLVWYITPV